MVAKMDELGFGNCTPEPAEAECPEIDHHYAYRRLNREFLSAKFKGLTDTKV